MAKVKDDLNNAELEEGEAVSFEIYHMAKKQQVESVNDYLVEKAIKVSNV